jgi:tetratricopeptide (TPR) repeat protein
LAPKDTPLTPGTEQDILRRQLLILVIIVAIAGLAWGIYSFGQDRGWGNPDRAVRTKLDQAQQAFVERRLDKAVSIYKTILERYPNHELATQALTSLATAYEEAGRLDDAIAAYRQLLARLGGEGSKADLRAFTSLQVAKLQEEEHDYAQALSGYQAVSRDFPGTDWAGEALQGLGKVYQDQGQFPQAISAYGQVIKALPKGFLAAEAQGSIGECYEALSQTAKAMQAYQKVIDDYPQAVWDQAQARLDALQAAAPIKAKHSKSKQARQAP